MGLVDYINIIIHWLIVINQVQVMHAVYSAPGRY